MAKWELLLEVVRCLLRHAVAYPREQPPLPSLVEAAEVLAVVNLIVWAEPLVVVAVLLVVIEVLLAHVAMEKEVNLVQEGMVLALEGLE